MRSCPRGGDSRPWGCPAASCQGTLRGAVTDAAAAIWEAGLASAHAGGTAPAPQSPGSGTTHTWLDDRLQLSPSWTPAGHLPQGRVGWAPARLGPPIPTPTPPRAGPAAPPTALPAPRRSCPAGAPCVLGPPLWAVSGQRTHAGAGSAARPCPTPSPCPHCPHSRPAPARNLETLRAPVPAPCCPQGRAAPPPHAAPSLRVCHLSALGPGPLQVAAVMVCVVRSPQDAGPGQCQHGTQQHPQTQARGAPGQARCCRAPRGSRTHNEQTSAHSTVTRGPSAQGPGRAVPAGPGLFTSQDGGGGGAGACEPQ